MTNEQKDALINKLKLHCLNMLGQMEKRENTIPNFAMGLVSVEKLELVDDERGSTLRLKPMSAREMEMGS